MSSRAKNIPHNIFLAKSIINMNGIKKYKYVGCWAKSDAKESAQKWVWVFVWEVVLQILLNVAFCCTSFELFVVEFILSCFRILHTQQQQLDTLNVFHFIFSLENSFFPDYNKPHKLLQIKSLLSFFMWSIFLVFFLQSATSGQMLSWE